MSHSTTTRQIIREIKITRDLWHERMINEQLRQVLHSHLENFKLTSTNQTGWVQYLEIPKTFLRGVECLQWADRDQLVALFKQFKYQILNALIDLTHRDSYEIIKKEEKLTLLQVDFLCDVINVVPKPLQKTSLRRIQWWQRKTIPPDPLTRWHPWLSSNEYLNPSSLTKTSTKKKEKSNRLFLSLQRDWNFVMISEEHYCAHSLPPMDEFK